MLVNASDGIIDTTVASVCGYRYIYINSQTSSQTYTPIFMLHVGYGYNYHIPHLSVMDHVPISVLACLCELWKYMTETRSHRSVPKCCRHPLSHTFPSPPSLLLPPPLLRSAPYTHSVHLYLNTLSFHDQIVTRPDLQFSLQFHYWCVTDMILWRTHEVSVYPSVISVMCTPSVTCVSQFVSHGSRFPVSLENQMLM